MPVLAFGNGIVPKVNVADIIGKWTVKSIEFSDCPLHVQDRTLNMYDSNCFTTENNTELCVIMDIDFQEDGNLTQTFKTFEDGKLIEHKVEKSLYTIGKNTITICSHSGSNCETSLILLQDSKLTIKGRDVTKKCYILLESTK